MLFLRCNIFVFAGLLAGGAFAPETRGQAAAGAGERQSEPPFPALLPVWRSPVDYFRQLLAADPVNRARILSIKTPAQRQVLERSLIEYDALSADEREQRLLAMDLRACLAPLIRMAPSNRVVRLVTVPEPLRDHVECKLRIWDQCPSDVQRLMLEHESLLVRTLTANTCGATNPTALATNGLSTRKQAEMEKDITRWNELPPETRKKVYSKFEEIMSDGDLKDKKKQFANFNAAEREQMEKALVKYNNLAPAQRWAVLKSIKTFTEISPQDRQRFLKNAEEWEKLSPQDRQAFRALVNLLPPGFGTPPMPPLPPGWQQKPKAPRTLATNQ